MLLYNAQKEFIGIDERDLKILGFATLASLKNEAEDFADLFVKTPGYIHNFKHVHWIDFVACADSGEESHAIINVGSKNFKCRVSIESIFLADKASTKAYVVYLNNLRELTKQETQKVSGDIESRPEKTLSPAFVEPEIVDEFDTPQEELAPVVVQEDPYEAPLEVDFDAADEFEVETEPEPEVHSTQELQTDDYDEILDVGDLSLDEEEPLQVEAVTQTPSEASDNAYIYNPMLASEELGLPLDLIEEFIQDFIAQAKEFQPNIYKALDEAEFDQVKILSHKLKGVAANLRIEDAFEALSVVNTSDDSNVIQENLNTFYKIIAKLAGEEASVEKTAPVADEALLDLDFKEEDLVQQQTLQTSEDDDLYGDLLDIEEPIEEQIEEPEEESVPQKIAMAELADDDFSSSEIDMESLDNELNDIEDIELLELDKELEISEDELSVLEDELSLDLEDDMLTHTEELESVSNAPEYLKESVANEIGLDLESFNELFEDYVSESKKIVTQMKNAIEQGDVSGCKYEALKLQGMSDNMRVDSFTEELNILKSTAEKSEQLNAVQHIEEKISQITRTGA